MIACERSFADGLTIRSMLRSCDGQAVAV